MSFTFYRETGICNLDVAVGAEAAGPGIGGRIDAGTDLRKRMSAQFAGLASLADQLAATTKKLEKRALIAAWLKELAPEEAALGALYLAGTPFAETDRRSLNVGGAQLSKALATLSQADDAAMHAAYRKHGDLGAAAFDLLAGHSPQQATLTLGQLEESLAGIAAAQGPAAKGPLVEQLFAQATPLEAKYLIKLISGDMRIGVKQSLIEEAIAQAYGATVGEVRHAMMLLGSLPEVVRLAAAGRLGEARMTLFHPLGFMLASPVATVAEALERFAVEIAAEHAGASEALPAEERGERAGAAVPRAGEGGAVATVDPGEPAAEQAIREAQMEDKYDGIRAQLHCGDPGQPGRVALFSRTREDMTASFPELVEAFAGIGEPAILDGEILAWSPETGRPLPFSSLQQRIGRKKVTEQMRNRTPVVFMVFDVLYAGGELLLERPLSERRSALESWVDRHASGTRVGSAVRQDHRGQATLFGAAGSAEQDDAFPRLVLAGATPLASADQLEQAYVDARARGNEGVMLKARHSIYQPGRRGLAWLKLKRELATLDVVVTAAEYGHGRRAGVLSDYTFAVRDGNQLKNVGKAYSGLTDAEIEHLTQFFLDHTLEDHGYVRSVEPVLVLEVAFNNVMRSERHASGFALRFPRILRIRDDKPVEEIDTLARVEEIYNSQPDKPVES
jgi:DNA ligase-1